MIHAPTVAACLETTSNDYSRADGFTMVAFDTTQVTSAANYSQPKPGDPCHPLAAGAHPPAIAFSAKDHGADAGDVAPTLRAGGHTGSHANGGVMPAVAYALRSDAGRAGEAKTPSADAEGRVRLRDPGFNFYAETAPTLDAGAPHSVGTTTAVRRLTPVECERLQGFPDYWTLVPYRGKPAADGPRYKAIGNSFAVPVVRWIGRRIAMVEALGKSQ